MSESKVDFIIFRTIDKLDKVAFKRQIDRKVFLNDRHEYSNDEVT